MTTITPTARKVRRRGFTLTEVMIAMSLTVAVMSGVMGTTLMIYRNGYAVQHYAEMESESRHGLEVFARDVRSASSLTWNSASSVTLVVPTGRESDPTEVWTYRYDATARTFSRVSSSNVARVLFSGIVAGSFDLRGFKIGGTSAVDLTNLTIASNDTKQLQLSLSSERSRGNGTGGTQKVISARFILRNKPVAI